MDDNDELRGAVAELFKSAVDFEWAQEFSSASAALEALALQAPPEVILLDLHLGDENGLDFIRPLKRAAPATDVIMLTAFSDFASAARASAEGASGFLLKSYSANEVIRLVRQTQENPGGPGLFPNCCSMKLSPKAGAGRPGVHGPKQCRRRGRNFLRSFLNVFTL